MPDILGCHGDAKVVFVGDGDNKMHCDHRAKEMNIEGSCRFLGAKSGEELVNLCLVLLKMTFFHHFSPLRCISGDFKKKTIYYD